MHRIIRDRLILHDLRAQELWSQFELEAENYISKANDPNASKDEKSRAKKRLYAVLFSLLLWAGASASAATIYAAQFLVTIDSSLITMAQSLAIQMARTYVEAIIERIERLALPGVTAGDIVELMRKAAKGAVNSVQRRAIATAGSIAEAAKSGNVEEFAKATKKLQSQLANLDENDIDVIRNIATIAGVQKYMYVHTNNMEGICRICAPFVGRICNGTGDDGVPPPPQHPNCKCALVPYLGDVNISNIDPIAVLRSLKGKQLESVIGKVRYELLKKKVVDFDGLFTPGYGRMKTLAELGLNRKGKQL